MDKITDIRLTREPLDVFAAQSVICPEAGGVAIFLGTTRAEMGDSGNLVALDYHAYDEMALRELEKLAVAVAARWPVSRAVIWHRLGQVRVGEASVLVAVSCPHRDAAFAACAWLMDELKKTVPIWKREIFQDRTRWQGEDSPACH